MIRCTGTSYVPVNEDVQYWQFLSGKLTATGDYTSAEFAFVYENNGNEAWFDGAQLFRDRSTMCIPTTMTVISRP